MISKTKILGITVLERTTEETPAVVNTAPVPAGTTVRRQATAMYDGGEGMVYLNTWPISYNGEKNFGELGPIKDYKINFEELRARHHQLNLESDIFSTLNKRKTSWFIDGGLKLQSEPSTDVLEDEGIRLTPEDVDKLSRKIESRFKVFANSTMCDYSNMRTLSKIAEECFENALSGDVLVLLRVIKGCPKIQLVDGCHVQNPINLNYDTAKGYVYAATGNRVQNGVEIDATGQHVAYHVRKNTFEYERIVARGKSGHLMAFFVMGKRLRLNHVRGITEMAPVMESIKKLERYKEAALGSAEERAKIPYFQTHDLGSTGEGVMLGHIATGMNPDGAGKIPTTDDGVVLANKFAATTNKQMFNLPQGSDIKVPDTKPDISFEEFYKPNADAIAAASGIPPEVAFSKYDSNYSASRGAMKDWEHTIFVGRADFAAQFYQRIYALWFEVEVLNNKIDAPGYLQAVMDGNLYAVNAYLTARWVGAGVPQIDPVKEVEALIRALSAGLITIEAATEMLNNGDAMANLAQLAKELEFAESKGLKLNFGNPAPAAPPEDKGDGNDKPDETDDEDTGTKKDKKKK
jgi:capsid protein